jgi:aspartate carbamoyltransferase catalytic subunit
MGDLGGKYIDHSVANTTEDKKSERIEDIILTIGTISPEGIIAMRHEDEDAIWGAALVSLVPLINAGSGTEHHPTQAWLDALTIELILGRLHSFSIAFVGDLLFGRTADSLAYLLTKFENITMYLVSRDHLRMKRALRYYLDLHRVKKNLKVIETADLPWVIDKVDILYQTRAQKERAGDASEHQLNPPYILNRQLVECMKLGARIMHPWPRNEELPREIDDMPQQLYIKQMYYGRMLRRALLAKICYDNPPPT